MRIAEEISNRSEDFMKLLTNHKVNVLYAFGSSVTDKFDPSSSDIDLVVEIDDTDPIERGEKLISLWDNLENFFQRKVDLLTTSSIKNPYLKKSIDATKVLIYDRSRKEVLI
tara:strand:- start:325 stop:660 length:336 start_codon:yes stop_codon:yes gene_type:complete